MYSIIRAPLSGAVSEREKANRSLARRACAEGMVLLKNKGALPLSGGEVCLFGRGVRRPQYGGTGSGETRPRERVNVEQGFLNAGWRVLTARWLDETDAKYAASFSAWEKNRKKGEKRRADLLSLSAGGKKFSPPYGVAIGREDALSDTAVYVLTRKAGEGCDRRPEKGDFLIADEELEHLRALKKLFAKTVLVINAGGLVDLSFDEELDLDAIVYGVQGGMEYGNALADMLTGKACFCGKLADSWGADYDAYPYAREYGGLNGDISRDIYKEDVFVGYKWFESLGIRPRYPFGFGLSYTDFCIENEEVSLIGGRAVVTADVRNTGNCEGREIVQVYAAPAKGSIAKERQRLVAFAKTPTLASGASCRVQMLFDLTMLASYFEQESRYKIEAGDYILRVGNSSDKVREAAAIRFRETVTTEICRKATERPSPAVPILTADALSAITADIPVIEYGGGIVLRRNDYTNGAHFEKETEELYKKLKKRDKARLVTGAGYWGQSYNLTFGAVGRTTSKLVKKGIPNINLCDGPQGLNLKPRAFEGRIKRLALPVIPEDMYVGLIGKLLRRLEPKERKDSVIYYQYCTQWPCEALLAQTWDTELMYEIGRATGRELLETGVTLWLAPGMNLHRNPLCGRNFEYYSEDPLLTGKMAAALSQGVNACGGVGVTYKHFVCNEREENRRNMTAELSERALRETYLKAFEIAVKEGNPAALMTSYNRVNGKYAANDRVLCTDVLRSEWGFSGVVMTDWFATGKGRASAALCIASGNDLVMPGSAGVRREILRAYRKGRISERAMANACKNVLAAILSSAVYADGKRRADETKR